MSRLQRSASATEATDYMAGYEGFGEMRSYTEALEAEQVAFTWRQMPPGTGGRGSYGHRHRTQEEIYSSIPGDGHVQDRRRRLRGRARDGGEDRARRRCARSTTTPTRSPR